MKHVNHSGVVSGVIIFYTHEGLWTSKLIKQSKLSEFAWLAALLGSLVSFSLLGKEDK